MRERMHCEEQQRQLPCIPLPICLIVVLTTMAESSSLSSGVGLPEEKLLVLLQV
jgi:hypothetical protein